VCGACKYLHFVPQSDHGKRRGQVGARLDAYARLARPLEITWTALFFGCFVFIILLDRPTPNWLVVIVVVLVLVLGPGRVMNSRLRRVWLLDLDDKEEEEKREASCAAVIGSRESGGAARICEHCGGTGRWGWLSFNWDCRKCHKSGVIPSAEVHVDS